MSSTVSAPTVSVAICLHDSSPWIEATLESALAQTYTDFEVVVLDDGSTDGCLERVRARFSDPRLRLFRQAHQGLGAARRASVAHARGEFVAFLDHDDLWRRHKLERQVAVARANADAGLVFSDCELIDAEGCPTGRRLSDLYDYHAMDLRGRGLHELLQRGCFIDVSTVLARTTVLREAGSFDSQYRYVEDFDMWLRVARRRPLVFVPEPLGRRRIHDRQFTRARPDVALQEQFRLLRAVTASGTYPAGLRRAVGDYLFGQHRQCGRRLLEMGRVVAAARTAVQVLRLPGRLFDALRHRVRGTPAGQVLEGLNRLAWWTAGLMLRPVGAVPRAAGREIWIDGSPLCEPQTGYFNLVVEVVRGVLEHAREGDVVHVVTPRAGRAPLQERLREKAARVRLHGMAWRFPHWTTVHRWLAHWSVSLAATGAWIALIAVGMAASRALLVAGAVLATVHAALIADAWTAAVRSDLGSPRLPFLARGLRFLHRIRRAPRPGGQDHTVEVVVWRGRFRQRRSRKIAIVPDLTPRLHPEMHTPGNVIEFEEYLRYAVAHADRIATLSDNSRRDIVAQLPVYPDSVVVVPMRVDPTFLDPECPEAFVRLHGIEQPYVLCVGTVEPRKNLRRVVNAFERIAGEACARDHLLVLAGPDGWDTGFERFLMESDVKDRVRKIGFVALDHLPSLYRHASAFVYASLYEGYGLPVLEAMCSSAVVLASRTSSLPEVLGDGIAFDPGRTEDIAAAMRRALSMPADEAQAYRAHCRARATALLVAARAGPPLPGLDA
jgi:glycosyltransferase involved in cell wall biosynthesis